MVDFAFIDSGTGGIPYLLHMMEVCPQASCVYIGDTANFPYGEKTHEQIVKAVLSCVEKIIKRFNPSIIVLACNTMSVNTLDVLREVYPDHQFVGTVPAIKLAASISKKKAIGLLATKATVENPYNMDLKNHFAADCRMELRADSELISFIEHKSFTATAEEREAACKPAVDFFREKGCDAIILGCTHFLNVKEEMQKICGDEIKVVDSVEGVINRAMNLSGGVTGNLPVRRGGEQQRVSQGETSPSIFITGFNDKKDEKEYDVLCKRYKLNFGGKL